MLTTEGDVRFAHARDDRGHRVAGRGATAEEAAVDALRLLEGMRGTVGP